MGGKVAAHQGGTETETLDGVALLGGVLAAIGVGNRMALHRHLVVGDEVGVQGGEETGTGTGIVTMISEGCHRLEEIVILPLPGVVHAEDGTVEVVGDGRGTRDLAVRPAETPVTIETSVQTGIQMQGRYYVFQCSMK